MIPSVLKWPLEDLSRQFIELTKDPNASHNRLALFPLYHHVTPGKAPHTEDVLGVQLEGNLNLSEGKKTYAVIQAVIRLGSLQIWWMEGGLDGKVQYRKYPLTVAFDSSGKIRPDLLDFIYSEAVAIAEKKVAGVIYIRRVGEPVITLPGASLGRRLGWKISPQGQPLYLNYLGQQVLLLTGEDKGKVGTVIYEAPNISRVLDPKTGGVSKSLRVLFKNGKNVEINNLQVALIDYELLREGIDPLFRSAHPF